MDQNWLRLSPLVTAHRKWKDIPQQRRVPTPHIFSSNLFDSYSWLRDWGTRAGAVWVLWNLRSSGVLPSELNDPSRSSLHKLHSHIISSWLPTHTWSLHAREPTGRIKGRIFTFFLPFALGGIARLRMQDHLLKRFFFYLLPFLIYLAVFKVKFERQSRLGR